MSVIISYDRLEDDIVARLTPIQSLGFILQALPETEAELTRPSGHNARITVSYGGSNFGDNSNSRNPNVVAMGVVSQNEFCDLVISFEAQRLRENRGLYEAVRQAKRLILGHQPLGWSKIFFKTLQFINHRDGNFTFHLTVSCYRLIMEAANELNQPLGLDSTPEEEFPPFSEGTANISC